MADLWFFSILIPNIFTSIRSIARQFPDYVENLTNWSAKFLEDNPDIEKMVIRVLDEYSEEFTKYLNESIIPQMEALVKQLSLSMISVLKALWNIIIGVIISIYVLYNKEIHAGQAKKSFLPCSVRQLPTSLSRMSGLSATLLSDLSAAKSLIP